MTNWIEWNGGSCPLQKGALVDIKLRGGEVFTGIGAMALCWKNRNMPGDIVAYRVQS